MNKKVELAASLVAAGHCVIINDCDRPSGMCVAVVAAVDSRGVSAEYLAEATRTIRECFNSKRQNVTPINDFGVRVYSDGKTFFCEKISDAVTYATYPDGLPRVWQEQSPVEYEARSLVIEKAKLLFITEEHEIPTP